MSSRASAGERCEEGASRGCSSASNAIQPTEKNNGQLTCILQATLLRCPACDREVQVQAAIRLSGQHFAGDLWRPLVAADHTRPDGARLSHFPGVPHLRG